MTKSLSLLSTLLLALAVALPALALDKDNPFDAVAAKDRVELSAGAAGSLEISYQVFSEDFFIYRDMSSVAVTDAAGLELGEAVFPKGKVKFDKVSETDREIFAHTFSVKVPVKVPAGAAQGEKKVKLSVKFQGCNKPENYCLFPTTKELEFTVAIGAGSAATAPAADAKPAAEPAAAGTPPKGGAAGAVGLTGKVQSVQQDGAAAAACAGTAQNTESLSEKLTAWVKGMITGAQGGSFLVFLLLVFAGGVASSLTPCVYPMIPITISVIGASAEQGRGRAFSTAVVYVLGIVVTYTALGVFAALTGGMIGSAMQSTPVIIGISLVFFVLALSMLGAYEFGLPSSVMTKASMAGGAGYAGAFIVGTVAGVVAAPCTGPIVAMLLLHITGIGMGVGGAVAVMGAYSLGLGMLFLMIGLFAGALGSLPRSGAWMDEVKHVFGVVMVAAAVYYAADVLPASVATVLWVVTAVVTAGVVGGWGKLLGGERSMVRLSAAVVVLLGGLFLIFKPVPEVPHVAVTWGDDHAAGLQQSRDSARPLLVDFTADWCAACQELEHFTYTDPAVVACAAEFVPVMIDGTKQTPEFNALRDGYGFGGLPAVYFVCPDGQIVTDLTLKGFEAADVFLGKMNSALHTCKQG